MLDTDFIQVLAGIQEGLFTVIEKVIITESHYIYTQVINYLEGFWVTPKGNIWILIAVRGTS